MQSDVSTCLPHTGPGLGSHVGSVMPCWSQATSDFTGCPVSPWPLDSHSHDPRMSPWKKELFLNPFPNEGPEPRRVSDLQNPAPPTLRAPSSESTPAPRGDPRKGSPPSHLTLMPPKQPLASPSAGWFGSEAPNRGQQSTAGRKHTPAGRAEPCLCAGQKIRP